MALDSSGITSLSGMSSGLDTASIISQLTQLRRQPSIKLGYQLDVIGARRDGLQESSNLLAALRSQSQALSGDSLWNPVQTVSSSDEKVASVTRVAGAPAGSHSIQVLSLARAQQKRSSVSYVGASADDTLSIQLGAGAVKTVGLTAGDSIETIAGKINSISGMGVYASVVSDRLYLSGKSSGTANSISVTSSGSAAAEMGLEDAITAADTSYSLNGGATSTSSSNTLTDAVAGLSITLKSIGTAAVSVAESSISVSALADQVGKWVETYNSAVKGMRARISEQPVAQPQNAIDRRAGSLFNNSALRGALSAMSSWASHSNTSLTAGYQALSDLGITTAAAGASNAKDGQLSFDREAFLVKYADNPEQVKLALDNATGSATTEGLAQWTARQLDSLIGSTGSVTYSVKGQDAQKKSIGERQVRINERADRYSAQLRKQYNSLETSLSTLNSQSGGLSAALARL
jgi:flagellar hook-associated protein 2